MRPADKAYAWIRDKIFEGAYEPRTHLKETELAARIKVSRSPRYANGAADSLAPPDVL